MTFSQMLDTTSPQSHAQMEARGDLPRLPRNKTSVVKEVFYKGSFTKAKEPKLTYEQSLNRLLKKNW